MSPSNQFYNSLSIDAVRPLKSGVVSYSTTHFMRKSTFYYIQHWNGKGGTLKPQNTSRCNTTTYYGERDENLDKITFTCQSIDPKWWSMMACDETEYIWVTDLLLPDALEIVQRRLVRHSYKETRRYIAFLWVTRKYLLCSPFQNIEKGHVVKSPRYTGGDFMFLYRFVRRRRRRPQILVHAITFELFGFLSLLARLLALTCRLPD